MTRRLFFAASLTLGLAGALCLGLAPRTRAAEPRELTVFAAASLREVFQRLAEDFEKKHTDVKVRLNFAGSQELRVQIEHGARADVFASADSKQVQAVLRQNLITGWRTFARNEPVLVVPANNPAKLTRFSDLPNAERIVVGVPEVPIGAYTESILANSETTLGKRFRDGVVAHIRSRELNVRQVLTKVSLGEADAGIVYKTDALSTKGKVTMVDIPDSVNVMAEYPIAVLSAAPQPALAKEWMTTVLGEPGQKLLRVAGFHQPADAVADASKSR